MEKVLRFPVPALLFQFPAFFAKQAIAGGKARFPLAYLGGKEAQGREFLRKFRIGNMAFQPLAGLVQGKAVFFQNVAVLGKESADVGLVPGGFLQGDFLQFLFLMAFPYLHVKGANLFQAFQKFAVGLPCFGKVLFCLRFYAFPGLYGFGKGEKGGRESLRFRAVVLLLRPAGKEGGTVACQKKGALCRFQRCPAGAEAGFLGFKSRLFGKEGREFLL